MVEEITEDDLAELLDKRDSLSTNNVIVKQINIITCSIDTNMYLVIKQLFQCCLGNSQNYHPEVGGTPGELFARGR